MTPKLVLYSDQSAPLSDAVDARLLEVLPARGGRIGYVPAGPDPGRRWFAERERHYARYGISLQFFGLEGEFDGAMVGELLGLDAIHLSGGNTFRFLYWLRERGLISELQRYVAGGGVLIGMSAGAILMTRDIESAAVCGDAPYAGLTSHAGLGLVKFGVLPHFDGSAQQHAELARLAARFGGSVYGIPDGSGIVVDGSRVEWIGPIFSA
jgi:dipeptidase E